MSKPVARCPVQEMAELVGHLMKEYVERKAILGEEEAQCRQPLAGSLLPELKPF
jgi:hypothetical protein